MSNEKETSRRNPDTGGGDPEVGATGSSEAREGELREESVRVVRIGHGANCSSVGSVVDTLFLGAAVGGAIFAAVCAAMKVEGVTVVGGSNDGENDESDERDERDEQEAP